MKSTKLAAGLALSAALISGCSSTEQGNAVRLPSDHPNAVCPAVPEAFEYSQNDELFPRVGGAILDCAQNNRGTIANSPDNHGLAHVTFPLRNSWLTLSTRSRALIASDANTFAREITEMSIVNNLGNGTFQSIGYGSLKLMSDGKRYMHSHGDLVTILEDGAYLDTSTAPEAIACAEQMIKQTAIAMAAASYQGEVAPIAIPSKIPTNCNAA